MPTMTASTSFKRVAMAASSRLRCLLEPACRLVDVTKVHIGRRVECDGQEAHLLERSEVLRQCRDVRARPWVVIERVLGEHPARELLFRQPAEAREDPDR